MTNLIQQIKNTAAKAVTNHQSRLAEQERLKNEQNANVAKSTFDSLVKVMTKCEGTSGQVYVSMSQSFRRDDFLKLVEAELNAHGFTEAGKGNYIFRYIHPEIPGLSIWCHDHKSVYGGVEAHTIRFSFI